MKVVLFGAGKMYQRIKNNIKNDINIIMFIDNDSLKWGNTIDGIPIICPQKVVSYTFDFIFLLSSYQEDMKKQLEEIGVLKEQIIGLDQMERICVSEPMRCFGKLSVKENTEKILVYSHALNSTGAQNVLYFAIQMLQRNGYQLAVISKKDGCLRNKILNLNVPVMIVENPHTDNKEFIKIIDWADKVIVNTIWLYYAVEELLFWGKKVIWWIHETIGYDLLNNNLIRHMIRSDLLSVYAVSPLVKRRMIQIIGKDLNIGELAYGLPIYKDVRKGIIHQKKKIFTIIGGIGKIKGQDIFIKAVENLQTDYRKKAEFWIVGAGSLQEEEFKHASKYFCIKIVGEIENHKMSELYSQIDAVVCCSREEAMSVAVTEGCMNEKLVIVSDAAGNADYIEDGKNGLLFSCGDSLKLAQLMQWVIDHGEKAKEIGRAGKEIYEKHFTMKRFENNLLRVIQ